MRHFNKRLITFLFIALTWSLVWFLNKNVVLDLVQTISSLTYYFLGIIPAIGLLVAGLITRHKQPQNEMTVLGNSPLKSGIIVSIPIIGLTILGVENTLGLSPHLFGLVIGAFTMLYAFLEEFGWRGYLQAELKQKYSKWMTYLIVAFFWYLWHWYFLRTGNDPRWIMLPILIGASAGIGEVANSTKSILICGALHGLVNILVIYGVIAQQLSTQDKVIILAVTLIVWIPLLRGMGKTQLEEAAN